MSQIEHSRLLGEIDTLVSIKLQVVSYKWLSREFSVSSNEAKKFLEEFVQKHGAGLQVIYTLSGWLKSDPRVYHIKLVSGPLLADAKKRFAVNCSVQVYSVQLSIPKDPAEIWNVEFVQAEELFGQPPAVENCLRDNRFCSISNALVKRILDGTPSDYTAIQSKQTVSGLPRNDSAVQTSNALPAKEVPPTMKKEIKRENDGFFKKNNKPSLGKEKSPPARNDTKSCVMTVLSSDVKQNSQDAVHGGSDDENEDLSFKKASNGDRSRKRKVVFDFSDDEDDYENAVSLASPELPKAHTRLATKESDGHPISKAKDKGIGKSVKDEEMEIGVEASDEHVHRTNKISSDSNGSKNTKRSLESNHESREGKVAMAPRPSSPKRKRVLKTTIDDRGREVTEVVWEGEEAKGNDTISMPSKIDNSSLAGTNDRPPVGKRSSPAVGVVAPAPFIRGGKNGNKKTGGPKDPKQGNILTFFKKAR